MLMAERKWNVCLAPTNHAYARSHYHKTNWVLIVWLPRAARYFKQTYHLSEYNMMIVWLGVHGNMNISRHNIHQLRFAKNVANKMKILFGSVRWHRSPESISAEADDYRGKQFTKTTQIVFVCVCVLCAHYHSSNWINIVNYCLSTDCKWVWCGIRIRK